jgi:hypothetical protein
LRRQTDFDVAQTFAVGQLRKGHHSELLGAGERFHVASSSQFKLCRGYAARNAIKTSEWSEEQQRELLPI